jgi:putative salt-induced outer membrane protein YdiY
MLLRCPSPERAWSQARRFDAGRVVLLGLALILATARAEAQSLLLHLKNGDRLRGTLVEERAEALVLDSDALGRVTVPVAHIEKREALTAPDAAPAVPVPAALSPAQLRRLAELRTLYQSNQLTSAEYHAARAKVLTEPAAVAPVAPVVAGGPGPRPGEAAPAPPQASPPSAPARKKVWTGDVQAGVDLGFSEKNRQLYTGRLKLIHASGALRNTFDYLFSYGRTDGILSANRMDGSVKTDYELTRRNYVYNLAGGGYDEVRKIDLRYELGPGIGRQFLKTSSLVLKGEYGLNYQAQEFADDTSVENVRHRLAQDSFWKLNNRLTLDERVEFFPSLAEWDVYRLRVEGNVRFWLSGSLSLNLTVLDLYDTQPAQGVPNNDLQVRSSIGVKF